MPVDTRSLIGEWMEHWKSGTGTSDSVYLSIGSVEREQARGRVFIAIATPGEGYYNRDLPVSGVFDGTELHFRLPPALWLTLKVVGDRGNPSRRDQTATPSFAPGSRRIPRATVAAWAAANNEPTHRRGAEKFRAR
jgi:hypothetical protein